MNTADLLIIILVVIPGVVGAMYGFLNIIFSILAWVIAFLVSVKFSNLLSPLFSSYIEAEIIRSIVAFIVLFVIILMIMTALGYFVVKLLGRTGLTAADRTLGFFLGVTLGGFIVMVIVFLAGFTAYPGAAWWQEALLVKPFERVSLWGHRFLPENVSKYHGYEMTQQD